MQEDALLVPCGHQYHVDCLLTLVEISTQTLASFPPRCCRQVIPNNAFERYMTRDQRSKFAERQVEHDTPKRVYCANPRCSRFLGARDKRLPVRVYTCTSVACTSGSGSSKNGGGGTRTCARCKSVLDAHTPAARHACAHEPGHRATLRLGSRMGWVRCPACEELIERHGGCAHMTCVCGAQFCFRCRAAWKTCICVDWGDGVGADAHEARLFAPLEEGGDLGARLALWVPPALERDASSFGMGSGPGSGTGSGSGSRRGSGSGSEGGSGSGSKGGGEGSPVSDLRFTRPRSQSCSFATVEALRARESETVDLPATPLAAEGSPKASLAAVSIRSNDGAASCFPFFVDPSLIARGVHAQEIRRRRRATSL